MTQSTSTWGTGLAAGALAAALVAASPQPAFAYEFDMSDGSGEHHTRPELGIYLAQGGGPVSLVKHPTLEGEVDKAWKTAANALLHPKSVLIRFRDGCTVKLELSCNGCHGRGQFETSGGTLFVMGQRIQVGGQHRFERGSPDRQQSRKLLRRRPDTVLLTSMRGR